MQRWIASTCALPIRRRLRQHLARAALSPHLDLSRLLDQVGVLRLPRVDRSALGRVFDRQHFVELDGGRQRLASGLDTDQFVGHRDQALARFRALASACDKFLDFAAPQTGGITTWPACAEIPIETSKAAYLDRDLQRRLLEAMAERFPGGALAEDMGFAPIDRDFIRAMQYLDQHGLVVAGLREYLGESPMRVPQGKITAAGLDFLQDDGGLTAMLRTVTVRFEAETLRALMAAHIESAPIATAEKSLLQQWVAAASAEALKEGSRRLIALALDQLPGIAQILQSIPK